MVVVAEALDVVENEPDHGYDGEDDEGDEDEQQTGAGHPQLRAVQAAVEHGEVELGVVHHELSQLAPERLRADCKRDHR